MRFAISLFRVIPMATERITAMNEAIDEIKRLAEEFADARYEEAKDQDHGNGKADTEYCRAEVARTRAAMIEAIDRLTAIHADQARDAQRWREIQPLLNFLQGVSPIDGVYFGERHPERKGLYWWRRLIDSVNGYDKLFAAGDRQATQPVAGGKELP